MSNDIEVISDGRGVALLGDKTAIDKFLESHDLPSKELSLQRLGGTLNAGAAAATMGSEIASTSGRWVKLTEDSARALKQSNLMKGSSAGVNRAVTTTDSGKITGILEIVKPGALAGNPAVLAGAGGLMAQMAMQQTMEEITDYLARIDEKVDDILRAQKDAVLAEMIGVHFVIDEAMTIRDEVGRVSEVTWSKVQATAGTIATTQAYGLRALDALAEKLEKESNISDLAKKAKAAEASVKEWLAVLAHCLQLHEALGVLELDRVMDASPAELESHRQALATARATRVDRIAATTKTLLARMDTAAAAANAKVLLNPKASPAVVRSRDHVEEAVVDFQSLIGIELETDEMRARRWKEAAGELRDRALESGADRVDATKRLANQSLDRARSTTGRLTSRLQERRARKQNERAHEEPDDPAASES